MKQTLQKVEKWNGKKNNCTGIQATNWYCQKKKNCIIEYVVISKKWKKCEG